MNFNFLHVIITFIGFKKTFSNIRSHGCCFIDFQDSDLGFERVNDFFLVLSDLQGIGKI